MIRYALRCDKGHGFDGWFRSAEGFDTQRAAGLVSCSVCGSARVDKAPMAPAVPVRDAVAARDGGRRGAGDAPLTTPDSPAEAAMAALRRHVEAHSDYVGDRFAAEARAIHDGERPGRAIHGEARPDEARKLIEDGIPVAPLPFGIGRKAN